MEIIDTEVKVPRICSSGGKMSPDAVYKITFAPPRQNNFTSTAAVCGPR